MFKNKFSTLFEAKDLMLKGRIARLYPESDYGFIEAKDGNLVYFTRFCVSGSKFDKLKPGMKVNYLIMEQIKGLQASIVSISREN